MLPLPTHLFSHWSIPLKDSPQHGSWTAAINQAGLEKRVLLSSGLKNSPECGSWTAGISQAGLEEGCPIMHLLKELTRVCQLDSWYQPGWARGRKPYHAAA